jgi:hypothetical protein
VYPRGDSNARHRLRRPVLYPLSYGGKGVPSVSQRGVFGKSFGEGEMICAV